MGDSRIARAIAVHFKSIVHPIRSRTRCMGKLPIDRGMDVTPGGRLTVALPGLGELVHANPGLRAWLRRRTYPGLNTDGLPGLATRWHDSVFPIFQPGTTLRT